MWFVGGVLATWTGVRVALLWPAAPPLPMQDGVPVATAGLAVPGATKALPQSVDRGDIPKTWTVESVRRAASAASTPRRALDAAVQGAAYVHTDARPMTAPHLPDQHIGHDDRSQVITPPIVARPAVASRLRLDGWLALRPRDGDTLAFGQLGASQGGARLTYALDEHRRVALSARLSAPLRGSGSEAGLGIDIRPTRLPVHFLVEQRIGIDGGGIRPAAVVIAGTSTGLPARVRLDAYAQGGAVARRGGFIDGAAMVTRPVLTRANARLEVGTGTWGAAQRGAARLDVGPSIALVTPGAGGTLRLQLDYRARITGRARPGSGPALSLGGSF